MAQVRQIAKAWSSGSPTRFSSQRMMRSSPATAGLRLQTCLVFLHNALPEKPRLAARSSLHPRESPLDAVCLTAGEYGLKDYRPQLSQRPAGDMGRYRRGRCGTHLFSRGYLEQTGVHFWAVNASRLDDATDKSSQACRSSSKKTSTIGRTAI